MGHQAQRGGLGRRSGWMALSALMVILSLALNACAKDVPPIVRVRATPLPNGVVCDGGLGGFREWLGMSNPVTANGVVYVEYTALTKSYGAPQSVIVALRASDGVALWRVPDPHPAGTDGLLIEDGMLLVTGEDTFALRLSDGRLLWRSPFGIGHVAPLSPDPPDGVLYVANDGVGLFAFRVADGVVLWETREAPPTEQDAVFPNVALTAPVLAGDVLFVGSGDGGVGTTYGPLMAFRADTGAMLWHTYIDSRYPTTFGPIAVIAGVLYVNAFSYNGPSGILRVNPATGASEGFVPSTSPLSYLASQSTSFAKDSTLDGSFFFGGPPPQFPIPPPTTYNYGLAGFDGHVRWRMTSSVPQVRVIGHSMDTLYLGEGVSTVAVRLSDGAVLWTDKWTAGGNSSFDYAASPGYFFEVAPGRYDPCQASDSWAPELRTLHSADGSFAWVDLLDSPL